MKIVASRKIRGVSLKLHVDLAVSYLSKKQYGIKRAYHLKE